MFKARPGRIYLPDVLNGLMYCPALLATFALHVANRNFRDFSLINIDSKLSFRSEHIGSDIDTVSVRSVLVNMVNWRLVLPVYNLTNCLNL